jgi:hypothetical protein
MGLRPLACWACGFESRGEHGSLSVVSGVCCQVEVSATSLSLVQRCATECRMSKCDLEASIMRKPWLTGGCCAMKIKSTSKGWYILGAFYCALIVPKLKEAMPGLTSQRCL